MIDGYEMLEQIGGGGFSSVYLARGPDRALVAVKVLQDYAGEAQRRESFRRETLALEHLRHRGIVPLIESGVADDGRPFLVVPYYPSGSLADLLREHGRIALSAWFTTVIALCDALAFAHRNGVLHRDLKPSNVLVADDGLPVISDFGVAYLGATSEVTLAEWSSPAYGAPELIGGRSADEVAEVYSLAATAHFLLVGAPPGRPGATLLCAEPSKARAGACRADVPASLQMVLDTALSPRPEQRTGSVEQFRTELDEIRSELGLPDDKLPVSPTQQSPPDRAARRQPRRRIVAVGTVVLVGALGVAASQVWARGGATGPSSVGAEEGPVESVTTSIPPWPGASRTVHLDEPADSSPRLREATAALDALMPALAAVGGLDVPFPDVANTPVRFDYVFRNARGGTTCEMFTAPELVATGATWRRWAGVTVPIALLLEFEAEEMAAAAFAGLSLSTGARSSQCSGWSPDEAWTVDDVAQVEVRGRAFEMDAAGLDEWNTYVTPSKLVRGLEYKVVARIGSVVLTVTIASMPEDRAIEALESMCRTLRSALAA